MVAGGARGPGARKEGRATWGVGGSHWWLRRCHGKGASGREAEALIAGNLSRARDSRAPGLQHLWLRQRGAGQWVLPKGADPALQKASLKGGAASRGLCPFPPVCKTVWLSRQQCVQILCVWRSGDIMGYACVRGGKGLLRLLHLPLPTCLQDVSHVCH